MEVWKIMFLSKWVICRFHVNLPGCNKVVAMLTTARYDLEMFEDVFGKLVALV